MMLCAIRAAVQFCGRVSVWVGDIAEHEPKWLELEWSQRSSL